MTIVNRVEEIIEASGAYEYKWIDTADIIVAPWVLLKCQFGCPGYGRHASCPPNTPSTEECSTIFKSYTKAVIFRFHSEPTAYGDHHKGTWEINRELLEIEKKIFCAGNHKTFLLFMDNCAACIECTPNREECKQPKIARPTAEGMSVDVYGTVRKAGFEINVLRNHDEAVNRFAFLLVE